MSELLIGVSEPIVKIRELIKGTANTGLNVLITGETGVGKEVVARSLYTESCRASKNFVKINCAALPETLLESELYGYEKGSFTGAERKRQGKFQMADKGVLFLDEIGDMPLALQSKMLHVLQNGEFSPIGSDRDVKTDVWIIAATNKPLTELMARKQFREDLFYRLNIVNIDIPPLRERKSDILPLIHHFHTVYSAEYKMQAGRLPDTRCLEKLVGYSWPGNVRQLQNTVRKQVVYNSWDRVIEELPDRQETNVLDFKTPDMVEPGSIPASAASEKRVLLISEFLDVSTSAEKLFEDISLKKIKKQAASRVEKEVLTYTLKKTGWNKSETARLLGVSYKTVLYKTRELEIQPVV
mgnify:CR=1 FL=1